jgi:hypothetical protein
MGKARVVIYGHVDCASHVDGGPRKVRGCMVPAPSSTGTGTAGYAGATVLFLPKVMTAPTKVR